MIAIISMFFLTGVPDAAESLACACFLAGLILLGVGMTFAVSWLISRLLGDRLPSSFTLELPPYRKPQLGKIIARSLVDRTLFVLGRAVTAAIPAGVLIWCMANLTVDGKSLLSLCAGFVDPFAQLMGMDGFILMAFLLGFPANEIVMPLVIMSYLAAGSMMDIGQLGELRQLLAANGWTWVTAGSVLLFSLFHFPCATSCLTIYRETKSLKWTAAAFWIPTLIGVACTIAFSFSARMFIQ